MVSPVRDSVPTTQEFREWLKLRLESELELPLLADVASRVVELCDDQDTEIHDVQRALEEDPSLASNFLRIANSPMYAARDPIVSLKQAVARLGLVTTRSIALAESTRGRIFSLPGHEDRVRAIWRHSVVAAAFAREIARKLRRNVEGAFLCALLHDVGRPIVLQAALGAPPSLAQAPIPKEMLEAAMDEFHASVGGRLAKAWNLAEWTVAAVTHHHEPELAAPFEDEARVVRLADLLSEWALTHEAQPQDFPITDPVVEGLELYRDDIEALLALRKSVLVSVEGMH
jgi:putative nucleotidyltransferase with HDIG domain